MSKLKVYMANYDGRTYRLVAATSQIAAAKLMRTTLSNLRNYGGVTGNKDDCLLALSEPGRVFEMGCKTGAKWSPLL